MSILPACPFCRSFLLPVRASPANFFGASPKWGSRSGITQAAGSSKVFELCRKVVVPMRLPARWIWKCRALMDFNSQKLRGVSGNCRSERCGLCNFALTEDVLLSGSRERLQKARFGSKCRQKSCSSLGASSGRGGAGVGSSEEGFAGAVDKTWRAVREWTWPGLKRTMTQEVIRKREDDEGDWKYSPEWWGSQAGGWGRDEGETVFEMPSLAGNGVVSVTTHPASRPSTRDMKAAENCLNDELSRDGKGILGGTLYQVVKYDWRVLRFNSVTRQSVAKVKALATGSGDVILLQQPNCIAFESSKPGVENALNLYDLSFLPDDCEADIKSMISAGLVAVSLSGLDLKHVRNGYQKMHILCIGLGGGSLPLFLAHQLPGATVEVVEIDGVVISAAVENMGFPPCATGADMDSPHKRAVRNNHAILWEDILQRISVHEKDGETFVLEQAQQMAAEKMSVQYDLVYVDAYDGEDVVPSKLWDKSGPFLTGLNTLLNPDHGTVVVNLHTDSAPPNILERISGRIGPGFDTSLPQGSRVQKAAFAYRDVLLHKVDTELFMDNSGDATVTYQKGIAFTIAVALQGNICLVVSKGAFPKPDKSLTTTDQKVKTGDTLLQAVRVEAARVQNSLDISFDLSKRVSRGLQIVK